MDFIVIKHQDLRNLTPIMADPDMQGGFGLPEPVRRVGNRATAQAAMPTMMSLPMRDRPKELFTTEEAAVDFARKKSEENPGELYVVYRPLVVFEAKKPEKVDVVVKEFNAAGELVVQAKEQ